MGGSEPRVLVVTGNASLVIGLTFSHRGWDVASQTPDAETPLDGDVVVLDLGGTQAGVAVATGLPAGGRALVIGDEELDGTAPAGVQVLVRPYTVDELTSRIEHLLSPAGGRTPWVDPPELDGVVAAAVEPGSADVGGVGSDVALARVAATNGSAVRPGAEMASGAADDDVEGQQEATEEATSSAGRRSRRADRSEPRRTLTSRLFGRVADPAPATGAPSDSADDVHQDEQQVSAAVPVPEPVPSTGSDEAGTSVRLDDEVAVEITPDDGVAAAPTDPMLSRPLPPPPPAPSMLAAPAPAASAATAPAPAPSAPAATTLLERRVIQVPEAGTVTPPAVRPTRWRARRQKTGTTPERQLRERLARVLTATSELEQLVEDVPLLAELPALAAAIVREVQVQLEADTVALWRPAEDGWRLTAHHGLTPNEARWVVSFDQPLFCEVHATGGALLLDPVDAVQAAVAGIGGAHTESFMAAAVAAGPGRYGILAVGRDRQLVEEDLDTLGDLALEMAPGLAVAEQLARLRGGGAPIDASSPEGTSDRRPWRRGV